MVFGRSLVARHYGGSDDLMRHLAKEARTEFSAARKTVIAAGREIRAKLRATANICKANRLTAKNEAAELRGAAKALQAEARDWCKSRKARGTSGDASQDCASFRRRAQIKASTLRERASTLQARTSHDCAASRNEIIRNGNDELTKLMLKYDDAMEKARLYRIEKKKSNLPASVKRSASRDKFSEEFSPENRDFCKAHEKMVRDAVNTAKRRGLRLDPHEACDELAERDKANWLAEEGNKFFTPKAIKQFEREQEAYYREKML